MADLYAKRLETERKALWATCRLKGLAKNTPERQHIAEIDQAIAEHRCKKQGEMNKRFDDEGGEIYVADKPTA